MSDQNSFIKIAKFKKPHEALLHHNLNECRTTYLVFIEEVPEAFFFSKRRGERFSSGGKFGGIKNRES